MLHANDAGLTRQRGALRIKLDARWKPALSWRGQQQPAATDCAARTISVTGAFTSNAVRAQQPAAAQWHVAGRAGASRRQHPAWQASEHGRGAQTSFLQSCQPWTVKTT